MYGMGIAPGGHRRIRHWDARYQDRSSYSGNGLRGHLMNPMNLL